MKEKAKPHKKKSCNKRFDKIERKLERIETKLDALLEK